MRIRRGGAFLVVLLTSCGGAAASPSPKPISPPSTAVTSAPPAEPIPAAQSTSATATSTTSIAQSTITTIQPTTTTAFESTEQRIAHVVVQHGRQQIACFSAPTKCDVAAITAEQGTLRTNMTIGVSKMVERNYEARETDTDKYSMVVTGVMLADDGRSAVVHVCLWDAVPVFQVRGAPDGTDVLINSERNSQYRKYVVYLEDLHWLVGDTTKLSDIKGRNTCG